LEAAIGDSGGVELNNLQLKENWNWRTNVAMHLYIYIYIIIINRRIGKEERGETEDLSGGRI